ncbi:unnamed protein product, partial [Polarella glacialis]
MQQQDAAMADGRGGSSASMMQASLTAAKEARKRAELDAQLLANRIALLKQEEEKAWKKIEETKKRAHEINQLRANNENKFAAKEQFYKAKWESIRSAQTQNAHQREKQKATREAVTQGLQDARFQQASRTKEQSQQLLLQKKEREASERQGKLERGAMIKQRKEEGRRRLEEDRLAQLERFRTDYEARAAQEELLRSRTDALVFDMEREEMELIQRGSRVAGESQLLDAGSVDRYKYISMNNLSMATIAALGSDPAVANYVPQYDIYGHRHSSKPYRDKTDIFQKEIRHPKWLEPPPAIKTRTELQQARKQCKIPDKSYDFDGDGVVGQLDYFVGKCFDGDMDGRLNTGERRQAERALDNGFLDKYVRGLDATGDASRGCFVRQRRGVITAMDNTADISRTTYPSHFNAHKVPEHSTQTALGQSRKAELKGAGLVHGERWAAVCAPVIEPQPHNHVSVPRQCPISHISQRAEGDHELARVRGGLLPMSMPVNPEREYKSVGLERVDMPLFATRGQLMETRKEAMKRESEDLRAKGDEVCVPLSVRQAEREANEFEFRRPVVEPMTLTKLKDSRRQNKRLGWQT